MIENILEVACDIREITFTENMTQIRKIDLGSFFRQLRGPTNLLCQVQSSFKLFGEMNHSRDLAMAPLRDIVLRILQIALARCSGFSWTIWYTVSERDWLNEERIYQVSRLFYLHHGRYNASFGNITQ